MQYQINFEILLNHLKTVQNLSNTDFEFLFKIANNPILSEITAINLLNFLDITAMDIAFTNISIKIIRILVQTFKGVIRFKNAVF